MNFLSQFKDKTLLRLKFVVLILGIILIVVMFGKDFSIFVFGLGNFTERDLKELKSLVSEYENKKTYVNFPHKSIEINYKDLGITFNQAFLEGYFQKCRSKEIKCDKDKNSFLRSMDPKIIQLNQEKLDNFIENLNQEIGILLQTPDISFDNLSFKAYDSTARISVNKPDLVSQLNPNQIFSQNEIRITTSVDMNNTENQKLETENLVKKATATSLLIKYGRQPVYINSAKLNEFIELESNNDTTIGQIKQAKIKEYIDHLKQTYSLVIPIEEQKSIFSIAHGILFRIGDEDPKTAIILPIKGAPKTDGTYAKKYLELIKSQQRMYAFENGSLVDTYIVGTGLTWETPSGEFKILRKEGSTISYTGGWYMNYYMPIGTVYGLFFGFHEIPYRKNAQGQITSRDVNTMGSPATGGCIQLYREDAQNLYQWADIGTNVIIYD